MPIKIKKKQTKKKNNPLVNNVIKILINNGLTGKGKKRKGTKKKPIIQTSKQNSSTHTDSLTNALLAKISSNSTDQQLINTILKALKEKPKDNLLTNGNIVENLENKTIVKLLNEGNYDELARFYPKIKAPLVDLNKKIYDSRKELEDNQEHIDQAKSDLRDLKELLNDTTVSLQEKQEALNDLELEFERRNRLSKQCIDAK